MSWWGSLEVNFHPYLGKIPILTNIFEMGWNHQLDEESPCESSVFLLVRLRDFLGLYFRMSSRTLMPTISLPCVLASSSMRSRKILSPTTLISWRHLRPARALPAMWLRLWLGIPSDLKLQSLKLLFSTTFENGTWRLMFFSQPESAWLVGLSL